jgi:serine/threonine-protein kinase
MSMMRPGKPSSIEGIKRQAKRIKAERGLQHARALDEAAVLAGYQNFIHASRVLASKGTHAPGRETSTKPSLQKEIPMSHSRSDFHDRARTAWIEAIESAVGSNTAPSITWEDPKAIIAALLPIMGSNKNHGHLPGGGGLDFEGVERSPERGCIDLTINGRVAYRVKPSRLILERIQRDPAQSFFMLELDSLERTGVYPAREDRENEFYHEELVELMPGGEYYPRGVWDEGETPDGRKLPSTARLVVRVHGGKILFVTKGSIWNGSPSTYDGRHATMSAARIRGLIEGILDGREARAASAERS